jgi:hypothetical protein
MGRFRTLSQGLKNFVMSDDTSLDEALAAARSDAEREAVSQQLDAFHKTFNFCMTCRQYTCGNCWNEAEGRCLTCAPHLGHEILPAPFPQLEANGNGAYADTSTIEGLAWPTTDLRPPEMAAPPPVDAWPEDELPANALADRLAALGMGGGAAPEAPPAPEAETVEPDGLPEATLEGADAWAPEPEAVAEAAPVASESEPWTDAAEPLAVAAEDEVGSAYEAEPVAQADEELEPAITEAAPVAADVEAEPALDEPAPVAELEPVAESEPVAAEPQPIAELDLPLEPEPVAAEAAPASPPSPPRAQPQTVDDRAAAAASQTAELLARFRPGQSLDAALEAYEAAAAEAEAATLPAQAPEAEPLATVPGPEPVVAQPEPEPEPVALEPEPVAAEPEPVVAEPEPVAAEPEPVAAHFEPVPPQPMPQPTAATPPPPVAPREDRVEAPSWRIVAPDGPAAADGHPAPQQPAFPAAASAEPQWPSAPQWPTAAPREQESDALAFLSARMTRSAEDLWAASNQEVMSSAQAAAAPAIQACVSCGLSLSANARFCRRCGTRQG